MLQRARVVHTFCRPDSPTSWSDDDVASASVASVKTAIVSAATALVKHAAAVDIHSMGNRAESVVAVG